MTGNTSLMSKLKETESRFVTFRDKKKGKIIGVEGGSSRGGRTGKGKRVSTRVMTPERFISVKEASNFEEWTRKRRNIAPGNRVDLSDMRYSFDDRLLNTILKTPENGIRFYTKNKKCFDPNLYSDRRFEELFTKGEALKRKGQDDNDESDEDDEGNEEQEAMNVDEEESE
ncbi:hypothetical protein M9H77_08612 [Catharanthus roseus]|uniref:Uncharacterized protein n=1 Tax=Catharanthus roseus TaxID=4058 RepID=A0ACC0BY78_CATRO|nr:hypothetical protein M9H77_08612 [Catharanthus roseus]